MVGAILALAQNRITQKDFYEMLTIPSLNSWSSHAIVPSPCGLYLCNVEYDPVELQRSIDEKLKEIKSNFENEFSERFTRKEE